MAEPANTHIAVLVDANGDYSGDPVYCTSLDDAETKGGDMLRRGAAGLECYIYAVTDRVTAKITFSRRELPKRQVADARPSLRPVTR